MTRAFIVLALVLAECYSSSAYADNVTAARPNIILIFTDDHAYQAIGAYGSAVAKTPNIDRLAAEGMRFDACFVNNSLCGPSRAAILTGKYSHLNGFYRNGNRFDGEQQTFPKLLQKAGYQTAMIGKWHLESNPTGFDHWEILIDQGPYWNPPMIRNGQRVNYTGYTTDIIGELSLNWLKDRDKDKPFMLMFQHKAPHREWQPHPRHFKLYDGVEIPEPATLFDDYEGRASPAGKQQMTIANHMSALDMKLTPPKNLTPEQLAAWTSYYGPIKEHYEKDKPTGKALTHWRFQRYMKDYLSCVAAVDENIGKMLAYLDESGLAKNTIVIYASDQGFYLGEHGWYDKRWMYEQSLRTPLIARWPGMVKAGSVCKDMVANIDFAETFLEIAGAEVPKDMQGRSLVPVLKGQTPTDWRKAFYYHYYETPDSHNVARHYGVRTERYKLIHYYREDEWELFDLKNDPQEMKSIYADPANAALVAELKGELSRLQKDLGDKDPTGRVPDEPGGPARPGAKREPGRGAGIKAQKMETAMSLAAEKPLTLGGTVSEKAPAQRPAIAGKAFAIGAMVKPATDGVIAAQGGVSLGFSLFIQDGVPHFAVRGASGITMIKGKDKIVMNQWTHIAGVLDEKETLRLFVAGKEVASAEGNAIPRVPAEGLSIGEDAESPVTEYKTNALKGELRHVRLYLGPVDEKELATWISQ
jgi:arylsulfatase A-like enzyme